MAQRHKDLILSLERPGKADNWRAGSREGGQLAGRAQGRRTSGGQGPGKADKWRAGSREGGRAGSREGGQLAGRVQGEGLFPLFSSLFNEKCNKLHL